MSISLFIQIESGSLVAIKILFYVYPTINNTQSDGGNQATLEPNTTYHTQEREEKLKEHIL